MPFPYGADHAAGYKYIFTHNIVMNFLRNKFDLCNYCSRKYENNPIQHGYRSVYLYTYESIYMNYIKEAYSGRTN